MGNTLREAPQYLFLRMCRHSSTDAMAAKICLKGYMNRDLTYSLKLNVSDNDGYNNVTESYNVYESSWMFHISLQC